MSHEATKNPISVGEDSGSSSAVEFSTSLHSKLTFIEFANESDSHLKKTNTFDKIKELLLKNRVIVFRFLIEIAVFIAVFVFTSVYYSNQKIVSLVSSSQCVSLCQGSCQYGTIYPAQELTSTIYADIAFYEQSSGLFLGYTNVLVKANFSSYEIDNPANFKFNTNVGVSSANKLYPNTTLISPYYLSDFNETGLTLGGGSYPSLMSCYGYSANGISKVNHYIPTYNVFLTNGSVPSLQIFGIIDLESSGISATCTVSINGINIPAAQFSNGIITSSVAQCTTHTSTVAYVGTGLSYALTSNAIFKMFYYFYDLLKV